MASVEGPAPTATRAFASRTIHIARTSVDSLAPSTSARGPKDRMIRSSLRLVVMADKKHATWARRFLMSFDNATSG